MKVILHRVSDQGEAVFGNVFLGGMWLVVLLDKSDSRIL